MGKLSVKKVKLVEALSEETPCFTADVYEDGKLIAHVSNRGHGGCNEVHPAKGLTYKDVAHIDTMDAECEIMTLVEEANIVKKYQGKSFVLKKGDDIFTRKLKVTFARLKKEHPKYNDWVKSQVASIESEGYEVLNTNL